MSDGIPTASSAAQETNTSGDKRFFLSELQVGKQDKLGHRVEEILWIGKNYKVYRSDKGVYVQFSDSGTEEDVQRSRFTEICPELCELRYLTDQMRPGWISSRSGSRSSLYDHNIAQAIMLVMEQKIEPARQIAAQALKMAVERVTNDNTIRYVRTCLYCLLGCVIAAGALLYWGQLGDMRPFVIAAVSGATGAVLSIASRLQAFRLQPCNQSNMNYWMSGIRVGTGVISGMLLLLLAPSLLSDAMTHLVPHMEEAKSQANDAPIHWQMAATLGLIGGFAERLIPNLLRQTADKMQPSGTPVQAVRNAQNTTPVPAAGNTDRPPPAPAPVPVS